LSLDCRCGLRARFVCLLTALALSGCMRRSAHVARRHKPQSGLDSSPTASLSRRATSPSICLKRPCTVRRPIGALVPVLRFHRRPTAPRRRFMRSRCRWPIERGISADAGDRLSLVVSARKATQQPYAIEMPAVDPHAADRRGACTRADACGGLPRRSPASLRNGSIPRTSGRGGSRPTAVLILGEGSRPPASSQCAGT